MPYKCVVPKCESNYASSIYKGEGVFPTFEFPGEDRHDLRQKWIRFVNRADWEPSEKSRICIKHFEEKFLNRGTQRCRLVKKLDPVPTIYPAAVLEHPSSLPTKPTTTRKPPATRVFREDEIMDYTEKFSIKSFEDLLTKTCLEGYQVKRTENAIVYYHIGFREPSMFPELLK